MSLPNNTSKLDPTLLLIEELANPEDYIQAMESRGQTELVNSTSLPSEIRASDDERELLSKWGFEFGSPFDDDPLFCQAKLPSGWTKKKSDHSMWSHVVDEHGRARLAVFYKAAFYDRRASMSIEPRYCVRYLDTDPDSYHQQLVDSKTGAVLFEVKGAYDGEYYTRPDEIEEYAANNLPSNWRSPMHWEEQ